MSKNIKTKLKICSRCIYDERVPSIKFDSNGVCNYCHQLEKLKEDYGTGSEKGNEKFAKIIEQIKKDGKGKKYDCIIGVSGGTDSSYMLYLTKKWGLRPLAVHYDNTWNSAIATENIRKVLTALDIDLYTHVIDNKESDDIFRSFFYADVAGLDAATDLALAEVMYRAAWEYKVKYVLEGHSFIAEGITPMGSNYFDGKFIQSIHKMFGRLPMKTYPLMTLTRFLFWTIFARIQKIRPFWYIDYSKEEARAFLEKEYDWIYYGGHHLENRITSYAHSIYLPQKFNMDLRNNTLAALVRNGKMNREEAWKEYNEPPHIEKDLVEYFKKRLELSDEEYETIMKRKPKSWTEYPTYKKRFELLRPLFKVLAQANLVPMSFYLKYCFPMNKDTQK
ncbi:N-acetyl sugar amidotransferase [Candidatus Sulfurimonas baltica]|uniref:N-acetyl sugar amidotransferase n=1 Tax=Candidatus Sulfurimonas baltica TaxID=2740404 RepID=A0A7S7LXH7_9BACT|nr:N-acetyl sugar amidotransferase [Candidatus Sulfurimonas baltica]QOY52683.1 N-acetyl sugar amidotransferase [Candidatus Sulfurimonas baltica]